MKKLAITTANKYNNKCLERVLELVTKLNASYIPRNKESVNKIFTKYQLTNLFVINNELQIIWHNNVGLQIKYHPGMAVIRAKRMQKNEKDYLIDIMELEPSDTVLDCTLGFASDAVVLQYFLTSGQVVGLESQALLASFVEYGLDNYRCDDSQLLKAMKKINVCHVNHYQHLLQVADSAYDVVYFDPMFQDSKLDSFAIQGYASETDKAKLTRATIQEAIRVCKKKVVLKEKKSSREFKRLGFKMIERPNIEVTYGIINK